MLSIGVLVGYVLGCWVIHYVWLRVLRAYAIHQRIYELAPPTHQLKHQVPSSGGIAIVLGVSMGLMIIAKMGVIHTGLVWWVWILGMGFALIGILDDGLAYFRLHNTGLSVLQKFGCECLICGLALWGFSRFFQPLSGWECIFYAVLILGAANATNLTDGLDGLLGGLALITSSAFALVFYMTGMLDMFWFCVACIVNSAVFLMFNINPARMFMGDVGSLMLGAWFAGLAICLGKPWILLSFGAVYVIETVSVILQVMWYKRTRYRLFLMAPLHHHFELLGWHERRVVWVFWGVGLGFVVFYFFMEGVG